MEVDERVRLATEAALFGFLAPPIISPYELFSNTSTSTGTKPNPDPSGKSNACFVGVESGEGNGESPSLSSVIESNSKTQFPSFHFSGHSNALMIFHPRYELQVLQVDSWMVCAPEFIKSMEGFARTMLDLEGQRQRQGR